MTPCNKRLRIFCLAGEISRFCGKGKRKNNIRSSTCLWLPVNSKRWSVRINPSQQLVNTRVVRLNASKGIESGAKHAKERFFQSFEYKKFQNVKTKSDPSCWTLNRRRLWSPIQTEQNSWWLFQCCSFDVVTKNPVVAFYWTPFAEQILSYSSPHITSNDRSSGCPFIYTDTNSQCYFFIETPTMLDTTMLIH